MNKKLLLSLLLVSLISLGFNSCVLPQQSVVIYLPEQPILKECPTLVVVEGDVVQDTIILTLDNAQKLRTWIHSYMACVESNRVILNGHIEKLENRLKAIGGR